MFEDISLNGVDKYLNDSSVEVNIDAEIDIINKKINKIDKLINGLTDKSEVMVKEQPLFEDETEQTQ
jgi:hypothetical protein